MGHTKEFLHEDDIFNDNNSEKSFALHVISDSEDSEVTLSPVMPADYLADLNHEQVRLYIYMIIYIAIQLYSYLSQSHT